MNFSDLIKRRESCRKYADQRVTREQLTACLEEARLAPSACNSQPWNFTVVDNPDTASALAKCTQDIGMNRFTNEVPAFVVVTEEKATLSARIGQFLKSQTYAQIDIGLATAYFTLAAAEQGLGTCILGWFNEDKIKELTGIAKSKRIRLVICVGYPALETPREKVRKPLDEIVTWMEAK
mgnify:CR=1 FL=1